VEATYLAEKGKIPHGDYDQLTDVFEVPDSNVVLCPLDLFVARAVARIPRSSVPDLPDRVIAATALALNLPLVTRDEKIRALPIQTIW
jgi:predicted nucleic acid-binding protein